MVISQKKFLGHHGRFWGQNGYFFTKICPKIFSASLTYLCLTAYILKSIPLALLKVILKTAYTPVDMIWHLDCVSGSKTWYLFKKNEKSTLSEKLPKIDKLYQPS